MIFAGGTGNPFFTTDTTAALRAAEIEAEALLKGTHSGVDGVYTADPQLDPDGHASSTRSATSTCSTTACKVMDSTAITFCMDNELPIVVFDLLDAGQHPAVLDGRARSVRWSGDVDAIRHRRSTRWRDVIDETLLDAIDKMDKAVEHVAGAVRRPSAPAGPRRRSSRSCTVDYYGSEVPLQQLAGFQVPEARHARGHARTTRASMGAIEKAIRDCDLGRQPDQRRRRHPPQLPAAHRGAPQGVREGRQAHGRGRPGRRAQLRRDARKHLEALEKDGEISADELDRAEKELEKITHEHVERDRQGARPQGARAARGLSELRRQMQ